MSIPVDLPGGQKVHEWPAPNLQAGVEELPGGGFRGIVLIGAAEGGEARTHVFEALHELRESAYREAVDYVEAQRGIEGGVRDDRSEHLWMAFKEGKAGKEERKDLDWNEVLEEAPDDSLQRRSLKQDQARFRHWC